MTATSRFWDRVRGALRGDNGDHPAAPPDAVAAMLRRAAMAAAPVPPRTGLRRQASFAAQLLVAQLRLIRLSVWTASVLVMGLGAVLAAAGAHGAADRGWPGAVLAMVAPVVTAAGIAGVCGPERDPGLELISSTATSARVVLVARVTLVFGYDLALALAASMGLAGAGIGSPGLASLIGAWLGPMALLSSLCLLLAVAVGTTVAVTIALTLWVTRLLAPVLATHTAWLAPVARGVEWLWSTNLLTGLLAVGLLAAAVAVAGRAGPRPAAA